MSDTINKQINITTNSSEVNANLNSVDNTLKSLDQSQTRVTQSTKSFNKETTTTTKAILDNGGAMGILNDATGGLAMVFKDATEAVELAGISLKGFRGALIATGIGAFVVILMELISNWEKWSGVIDGSTGRLEALNTKMEQLNSEYETLTYTQQTMLDFMELEGASLDEIAEKRRQNFEEAQALLIAQLEVEKQRQEEAVKSALMWSRLTNNLLGDWDKVAEAQKKVDGITRQLTKLSDDYYKATKGAEREKQEKAVEASKRRQLEIEKQRQLVVTGLQKSFDLIQTYEEKFGTFKYASEAQQNFKLLRETIQALNESIRGTEEAIRKSGGATKEQLQLLNNQKSRLDIITSALSAYRLEIQSSIDANDLASANAIKYAEGLKEVEFSLVAVQGQLLDYQMLQAEGIDLVVRGIIEETNRRSLLNDITKSQILTTAKEQQTALENEISLRQGNLALIDAEIAEKEGSTGIEAEIYQALQDSKLAATQELNAKLLELENLKVNTEASLRQADLDNFIADQNARLEMVRYVNESMMSSDEEYYNALMTTGQNAIGFLSMLQNESLVQSQDLRRAFLVLEKGLAIAQIVMGTIRQNSELRMKASGYTADAVAAYAQSLIPGPQSALYAAAGAGLTAAAAKTTAQIPLNIASAGLSIAGVLAQTLTSWNLGGGASGGSSAAGGGPQAQFNIVEASGTNQLAATIAAQQNQPVNAYVVGTDVSTQQALDRNRITNATFL